MNHNLLFLFFSQLKADLKKAQEIAPEDKGKSAVSGVKVLNESGPCPQLGLVCVQNTHLHVSGLSALLSGNAR